MKWLDRSKQNGFTLIEVIISIALLSMLFGLALYGTTKLSTQLFIGPADANLVNVLTTASRRARDGVGGGAWGVYLPFDEQTRVLSEAVVYKGSSYALRDTAYDQTFAFSERVKFVSVDFSGSAPTTINSHEVLFEKYSGQTSQYGSVELETMGVTRHVTVSNHGFVTKEL